MAITWEVLNYQPKSDSQEPHVGVGDNNMIFNRNQENLEHCLTHCDAGPQGTYNSCDEPLLKVVENLRTVKEIPPCVALPQTLEF
jgi:hypothetical protein